MRTRRLLALLAVLLLGTAPTAAAQDPFGPLPSGAQPTPTPTLAPDPDSAGGVTGQTTLFVIAGGLLAAFVAVGVWISRDARRATGADEAPAAARGAVREEIARTRIRKARSRARAKGRAQRAARRRNR